MFVICADGLLCDPGEAAQVPTPSQRSNLAKLADHAAVTVVTLRPALDARKLIGVPGARYVGGVGIEWLAPNAREPEREPAGRCDAVRAFFERPDVNEWVAAGLYRIEGLGPCAFLRRQQPDYPSGTGVQIHHAAEEAGLVPRWMSAGRAICPPETPTIEQLAARLIEGADRVVCIGQDASCVPLFESLRARKASGELSQVDCLTDATAPRDVRKAADTTVVDIIEILQEMSEEQDDGPV